MYTHPQRVADQNHYAYPLCDSKSQPLFVALALGVRLANSSRFGAGSLVDSRAPHSSRFGACVLCKVSTNNVVIALWFALVVCLEDCEL